jgi:hypothetical protein
MLNVWRVRYGTIHGTIHGISGVTGYWIQRASVRKEVVRAIGGEHVDCWFRRVKDRRSGNDQNQVQALGRYSRLHVERWRSKQRYPGLYSARIKIRGNVCRVTNEGGRDFLYWRQLSRPDQEQGPWRCDCSADPMMQRKLCSFGWAALARQ